VSVFSNRFLFLRTAQTFSGGGALCLSAFPRLVDFGNNWEMVGCHGIDWVYAAGSYPALELTLDKDVAEHSIPVTWSSECTEVHSQLPKASGC